MPPRPRLIARNLLLSSHVRLEPKERDQRATMSSGDMATAAADKDELLLEAWSFADLRRPGTLRGIGRAVDADPEACHSSNRTPQNPGHSSLQDSRGGSDR